MTPAEYEVALVDHSVDSMEDIHNARMMIKGVNQYYAYFQSNLPDAEYALRCYGQALDDRDGTRKAYIRGLITFCEWIQFWAHCTVAFAAQKALRR